MVFLRNKIRQHQSAIAFLSYRCMHGRGTGATRLEIHHLLMAHSEPTT